MMGIELYSETLQVCMSLGRRETILQTATTELHSTVRGKVDSMNLCLCWWDHKQPEAFSRKQKTVLGRSN